MGKGLDFVFDWMCCLGWMEKNNRKGTREEIRVEIDCSQES